MQTSLCWAGKAHTKPSYAVSNRAWSIKCTAVTRHISSSTFLTERIGGQSQWDPILVGLGEFTIHFRTVFLVVIGMLTGGEPICHFLRSPARNAICSENPSLLEAPRLRWRGAKRWNVMEVFGISWNVGFSWNVVFSWNFDFSWNVGFSWNNGISWNFISGCTHHPGRSESGRGRANLRALVCSFPSQTPFVWLWLLVVFSRLDSFFYSCYSCVVAHPCCCVLFSMVYFILPGTLFVYLCVSLFLYACGPNTGFDRVFVIYFLELVFWPLEWAVGLGETHICCTESTSRPGRVFRAGRFCCSLSVSPFLNISSYTHKCTQVLLYGLMNQSFLIASLVFRGGCSPFYARLWLLVLRAPPVQCFDPR